MLMEWAASLSVPSVAVLDAGACGSSGMPGNVSQGILDSHMHFCVYSTIQPRSWGRYHLCLCYLCLCLMQELVAAQARLKMLQKVYLPATYYAPCSDQHQSPADVNTIATQACSKRLEQGGHCCLLVADQQ